MKGVNILSENITANLWKSRLDPRSQTNYKMPIKLNPPYSTKYNTIKSRVCDQTTQVPCWKDKSKSLHGDELDPALAQSVEYADTYLRDFWMSTHYGDGVVLI